MDKGIKSLVVAPTMLSPQNVSSTSNAYYATMAVLNNVLIHNHEFISYKDKKAPIIYMKSHMHYIAVNDKGAICEYDNSPDITYHKCYGSEYWIFNSMKQPYVWITNGRDLTYAFNSNFKG